MTSMEHATVKGLLGRALDGARRRAERDELHCRRLCNLALAALRGRPGPDRADGLRRLRRILRDDLPPAELRERLSGFVGGLAGDGPVAA